MGNPPFVGKAYMKPDQKVDMSYVARELGGSVKIGVLDLRCRLVF